MISIKTALYGMGLFVMVLTSSAHADDAASQDNFTLGLAGQYTPRYSGSDKQLVQIVPVVQARKGAFFFDSQTGLGYDLQADNGVYLEHTLGYGLGRSDENSYWREGANNLKGMGNIDATMNTSFALGWSITPWLVVEGKAALPLTDSQGVQYQTSLTLIPIQNGADTVAFQSSELFGDSRYMNTFYGVSEKQSQKSGYAPYSARSGFYGVNNNMTWSHQFDTHWELALSAGYTWLGDPAQSSPIVLRREQGTGAAAITYAF